MNNKKKLLCKGPELLKKAGGLHKFMNWDGALLTVSLKNVIEQKNLVNTTL